MGMEMKRKLVRTRIKINRAQQVPGLLLTIFCVIDRCEIKIRTRTELLLTKYRVFHNNQPKITANCS